MAVQIGQTSPGPPARVERETVRKQVRTGEGQLLGQKNRDAEDSPEQNTRAGFGKDSLSPPGAALATVSTNLRRARKLVPSLEESQQRAREAVSRDQDSFRQQQKQLERVGQKPDAPTEGEPAATVSLRPRVEPRAKYFARDPFATDAPDAIAAADERDRTQVAAPVSDGSAQLLNLLA